MKPNVFARKTDSKVVTQNLDLGNLPKLGTAFFNQMGRLTTEIRAAAATSPLAKLCVVRLKQGLPLAHEIKEIRACPHDNLDGYF